MTKSKILLCLCLAFIGGILIDSLVMISRPIWLGILILAAGLIVFGFLEAGLSRRKFCSKKNIIVFGFVLLALPAGIWRHQSIIAPLAIEEIVQYDGRTITFKGIIANEPEQRISRQKFEFKIKEIPGKPSAEISNSALKRGKILVTTELYPEYHYGDELRISGKLRKPPQFEDFNYREYLAKDKIYSVIYYPKIVFLSVNGANWPKQAIFNFKVKLRKVIEQTLLPPQSSILKAVFLGDKWGLSNKLKEKLNTTGTRHIVAISGMHMVIMAQILFFLALAAGLWRGQAFYFVLVFLALYIIMVGSPTSAIRAGLMAGLLLLAQKVGRLRSADRAVVFAAAAILAVNPSLLGADVGFQLSFMAVLSIIYLKPILDGKTAKWPNPFRSKDILTMTLAAQLGALPILIFHFGRLSLISPLSNLLIVPLLPLIMLSGIVLSFTGLFWLPLAKIIAWPVWFLLSYLIKVVDYLSSLPLSAIEFKNISLVILIGYYLILALIVWLNQKQKEPLKI